MADAAREMENAGLVAAAAICREKAKDWQGARALWSRLAQVTERRRRRLHRALVRSTWRAAPSNAATRDRRARPSSRACGSSRRPPTTSSPSASGSAPSTLPGAGADRARERRLRGRAGGLRQLHPHLARGPSQVFRARVLRGRASPRRRARRSSPPPQRWRAKPPTTHARSASRRRARTTPSCRRSSGRSSPGSTRRAARRRRSPRTRSSPPSSRSARSGSSRKVGELYRALAQLDLEEARTRPLRPRLQALRGRARRALDAAPLPRTPGRRTISPRCGTSTSSSGSSKGARRRPAPTSSSTGAGRISSGARPSSRASPRSRSRRVPTTPGRRRPPRECGLAEQLAQPPALRGALAAGEALRASGARGEGRRAPGDADALLQAELHHRARRAARRRSGGRRASGQRDRVSLLPARLRSAVAHRS